MNSSSFKYMSKEGIKNVWLNRLMSFASIGVLTACLLLIGFATLLIKNIDNMISYIEQQSDVVVFIKDGSTEEQIDQMRQDLELDSRFKSVEYVSKDEALEEQKSRANQYKDAFIGLEEDNPIPASFRVSVETLVDLDSSIEYINTFSIVDNVNAPNNVATTIVNVKNTVSVFGGAVVIALIVVSLIIISNTIRATIFARRTEISIMKNVGATNNFIRIPFLMEGMTLGFISAVISFFGTWGLYSSVIRLLNQNTSPFLESLYGNLVAFSSVAWQLALAFVVAGVLTGALGSVMSLRSHLKV